MQVFFSGNFYYGVLKERKLLSHFTPIHSMLSTFSADNAVLNISNHNILGELPFTKSSIFFHITNKKLQIRLFNYHPTKVSASIYNYVFFFIFLWRWEIMRKYLAVAMIAFIVVSFSGQSASAKPEMGLRVSLGVVPGVDTFETTGPGGVKVSLDSETGGNLNAAFVIRTTAEKPVGFVGVVGPFVRAHTGSTAAGIDYELGVFGVSAQPGLAVKLSEKAHLEFKGELGIGVANQSITGFSDGSGPYVSVGVTAGAYFKVGKTFVLGGDVGYTHFTSTGELFVGGNNLDLEFEGSGPVANFSMGWMF